MVPCGTHTLKTQTESFDRRGNVIQDSIVDEATYAFNTTYDGLDRVKSVTGPASVTNAAQQSITNTYDAGGQVETSTNALGESTVTHLDALGRPTLVQVKSSGGAVVRSRSYAYSPDHQAVTVTDGTATGVTTMLTDFAGNPVLTQHADGTFAVSRYDRDENLLGTTDELGRATSYAYDGLNHLSQETLPDGGQIGFTFDALGDLLTRAMPAGLTWNATYDNFARQLTESLTEGTSTTRSYTYAYNTSGNDIGRLHTVTDPRSIVSTYSYDSFGRVATIDPGTATLGVRQVLSYDKRGLLTELDQSYPNTSLSPPTSVLRTYDGYGALLTEQNSISGTARDSWQENHDGAGRRIGLTEEGYTGTPFSFGYQADGALTSTGFNGGSYSYGYGTDGLLSSRTTPWKSESVVSRDSVGRVTEQSQSVNGATVLDEKLFWRGDSTLTGYTANRTGTGTWNESRQYAYDPRGHVLSENYAPASGTSATLRYHFDADTAGLLGLRTGVGLTGAATGSNTESFNGLAQLTQQATTGTLNDPRGTPVLTNPTASPIDAVGQITAHDPGTNNDALTWDSLGRLLEVSRRDSSNNGFDWTAVYDGFGRRLSTSNQPVVGGVDTGSPTTTASEYDPETEFMEAASTVGTSAGSARRWLVHGPDLNEAYGGAQGTGGIEAVVDPIGGTTTGVMSDAFGHTVATGSSTTANWNAVRSLGYGVQPGTTAQILDGSHDISTALAWRGKVIDPTGFYYLGSRYYDPASGTFLSADPLGHAASMDLYSYCNGDPVNNFDPDGRIASGFGSGQSLSVNSNQTDWNSGAFQVGQVAGALTEGGYQGETWNNFSNFQYGFFVNGSKSLVGGVLNLAVAPISDAYRAIADPYAAFTYPDGFTAYYEMQREQRLQGVAVGWNSIVEDAKNSNGQGELTADITSFLIAPEAFRVVVVTKPIRFIFLSVDACHNGVTIAGNVCPCQEYHICWISSVL